MPRLYYCSRCGLEVVNRRKSLKNKMIIIDLIEPHNCEDSSSENMTNITDSATPNKNYSKGVLKVERQPEVFPDHETLFQDHRPKDSVRKEATSTAPLGILRQIKDGMHTKPDKPMPSEMEIFGDDDKDGEDE